MKFHQALYVFLVICSFFVNLAKGEGVAYALGGTTVHAVLLAILIFGWAFLNDRLFGNKKKTAEVKPENENK